MPPRHAMLQMITGFWISQAIYVAARLGLADQLAAGPHTADEIAAAVGASPRELYRLLRLLAGLGIFVEDEQARFALTPLAETLRRDTAGSLQAMAIMYGEEIYRAWGNLRHTVQTSETAFDHLFGRSHFAYLEAHPEAAAIYNQAMRSFSTGETAAILAAYDFSWATEIVDVGGGQGGFLAAILSTNPHLRGTLFELPAVASGAESYLAEAGLTDRCRAVSGDFLVELPAGGDLYLLKNILLNWDDAQSITILQNCRQAMAAEGRLLIIEAMIAPRNEPSFSKLLDLHMMVVTGGHGRTKAELNELFHKAGFTLSNVIATSSPAWVIEGMPA